MSKNSGAMAPNRMNSFSLEERMSNCPRMISELAFEVVNDNSEVCISHLPFRNSMVLFFISNSRYSLVKSGIPLARAITFPLSTLTISLLSKSLYISRSISLFPKGSISMHIIPLRSLGISIPAAMIAIDAVISQVHFKSPTDFSSQYCMSSMNKTRLLFCLK